MPDQIKTSATKEASLEKSQPIEAARVRTPDPRSLLQQALSASPATIRLEDLLRLQRTVGNQVVQRMIREHVPSDAQPQTQLSAASILLSENKTGLPDQLKAGIETLSGLALDDVKVHYNSSRPATVDALAFTQGTEIHVGPGQEQHLAHEAWHVVQQKRGQVKQTRQVRGVALNDEVKWEKEADVMSTQAMRFSAERLTPTLRHSGDDRGRLASSGEGRAANLLLIPASGQVIQRMVPVRLGSNATAEQEYLTSPWIAEVRAARGDNADFSGVNYATFFFQVNGVAGHITQSSDQFHSEKECWQQLCAIQPAFQHLNVRAVWPAGDYGGTWTAEALRPFGVEIYAVYTEREPCSGCEPLLQVVMPNAAPVYWSFLYPSLDTSKYSQPPEQVATFALLALQPNLLQGASYEEVAAASVRQGRVFGNTSLKNALENLP